LTEKCFGIRNSEFDFKTPVYGNELKQTTNKRPKKAKNETPAQEKWQLRARGSVHKGTSNRDKLGDVRAIHISGHHAASAGVSTAV
jgi:hypothetical protein